MDKRILVVDDEDSIRRILKVNLERAGFLVEEANDGASALTLLLQNPYDLLISDVMMPEMDGLELVEHVRQDPEIRDMPVILLTARSSDSDITRGYMRGTDIYLTKPFTPSDLLTWVRRIFEGMEADPAE